MNHELPDVQAGLRKGTGTWNVKSMNQGKLEVVKQEMARVNIDILGISEQKWTGMKQSFSSPVATAEFSKFVGILSAALSQHHSLDLKFRT